MNMDIIDEIKADHSSIAQLLEDVAETGMGEGVRRRKLLHGLSKAILSHSYAEEQVLYRKLKEIRMLKSLVSDSYQEHRLIVDLLHILRQLNPLDEKWAGHFEELRECLEHHLREEERQVLPQVKRLFSLDLRHEIGAEMRSLEDQFLYRTESVAISKPDSGGSEARP
jgi:hemerythrin superfamily protein